MESQKDYRTSPTRKGSAAPGSRMLTTSELQALKQDMKQAREEIRKYFRDRSK